VEVAFVLDTTGSMGGLIEGAKRRIWSIARRIGEGRPRPVLRIALVGYRDLGDQYVTLVHDFSGDMDEVYERLMAFQASGGGDAPEHVSAALAAAVDRLSWSPGRAMRVIFLVGDAPPHVDYQDGYDYRRHAREARARGIGIEAIQCGAYPETEAFWREIATTGGGDYARIDAQGGMPVHVTPVDAELARLNRELAGTVVAAGRANERAEVERRLATRAGMPAAVAAEAASFYAAADRLAEKDLVGLAPAEQKKELETMRRDGDAAPPAIAGKTDGEALAYLEAQRKKRAQLQARMVALQKERDAYLAKAESATGEGFDEQVVRSLRKRAGDAGIAY
jgi:hypothetical protein